MSDPFAPPQAAPAEPTPRRSLGRLVVAWLATLVCSAIAAWPLFDFLHHVWEEVVAANLDPRWAGPRVLHDRYSQVVQSFNLTCGILFLIAARSFWVGRRLRGLLALLMVAVFISVVVLIAP